MKNTNLPLSPVAYPVVVTSPSGGGKTVAVQHLVEYFGTSANPVTITTRPHRARIDDCYEPGYFFTTPRLFAALLTNDALVESNVAGLNNYGTPYSVMVGGLQIMLFALDVDAASRFREGCRCTVISLVPESREVLKHRLNSRNAASPELIDERLQEAYSDIRRSMDIADYTVICSNENSEDVFEQLEWIVRTCAMRTAMKRYEISEALRTFEI